jgi:hypothetical protein
VNPAIVNENVTPTKHEHVQTAVDREIHQDHHHTSVQPIQHKEVLPEKHTHNIVGVDHRNIQHGNDDHVRQRLEAERAQFKDTRTVGSVQESQSVKPTIAGEHIHHHVHENIQPVIQKETIQPAVVHTTIPVHEVHQNESKHHTTSQLPAVTMDEFQAQGGRLEGRSERIDAFAGEPKSVGGSLGGVGAHGSTTRTEQNSLNGHNGTTKSNNGITNSNSNNVANGSTQGAHHGTNQTTTGTTTRSTTNSSVKKVSLMDKLNPKVDADGDGKAGFMK